MGCAVVIATRRRRYERLRRTANGRQLAVGPRLAVSYCTDWLTAENLQVWQWIDPVDQLRNVDEAKHGSSDMRRDVHVMLVVEVDRSEGGLLALSVGNGEWSDGRLHAPGLERPAQQLPG